MLQYNTFKLYLVFCIKTTVLGILTTQPFDHLSLDLLEMERSGSGRKNLWSRGAGSMLPSQNRQVKSCSQHSAGSLGQVTTCVQSPAPWGPFLRLLLQRWLRSSQN